jgi:hypothetical protein
LTTIVTYVTIGVNMKAQQKRTEKQVSEKALNIRNCPSDLLWACKAKAATQKQHLREFVLDTLRKAAEA